MTELAARHFGVGRASVNLIEADTQTFLACHGADWSSTPREASICTYAIVDEEPVTVIEDLTQDPRFAASDGLSGHGIRFYAGADVTADGVTDGTLCVYGEEPMGFDGEAREYLALLADQVGHLLAVYRDLGIAEGQS
ncbi:MAG: GAF domain-containing protein [Halobacteriales archaeon]|nr:GAF domain-containing protein [Halobacteriales archaeon]